MNGYMLDEEDPKLLNTLTQGTSQQMPPAPPPTAPVMAPPPMTQVPQLPSPQAPAIQPPQKLPGMPEGIGPNDLEQYLGQQKAQINKFGPQDILSLQQQNDAQRNSLGSRATSGLKGFADSIMMGVAGAGNPGWQKQYEDQQNQQAGERMNALKEAGASNIQQTSANMSMDKMNPSSPLSKAAQGEFGPILSKSLGLQPEEISKMSAAQMQTVAELGLKYADVEAQKELKKVSLDLQAMLGNANIVNQKTMRDQAEAEYRAKHPIRDMLGTLPKVGEPSGAQPASANVFTPDVLSYAQKHNVTPEQALNVKKKRGG